MPINPTIALGAQPQQQPVNMLGQLGQLYALKAAKQEVEGGEALREAFAQGGDLNDPAFVQRLRAANPKLALEIEAKNLAGQKTRTEILKDRIAMSRDALANVNTPEAYLAWHEANHKDPMMASFFASNGITAADSRARIMAELAKPGGLDKLKRESALGATELQKQLMQTERTYGAASISAGPQYARLAFDKDKDAREQRQQEELARLMRGESPTGTPAPTAGPTAATPVGAGSVPTGASAPTAAPATAPTNALAPTPTPSVNALAPTGDVYTQINAIDAKISQLMSSGNPKALASAQALTAQRNALLQSAKQQFGGPLAPMEVTDPETGQRTVIQGRTDQYGRLVPVEMGAVPLSTDASATGGTRISPTVARPAPTAAVIKERQAVEKLPEAIAMNTDAIRKIDEMIGGVDAKGNPLPGAKGKPHPGFSGAVGMGFGARFIPGTDAKSFEIRHKEVLGQAFLDAFEALKGGGAITEKEGEKATAARTRMDLAQSEKEYMDAAREYQAVLKRGVENARQRIQRSGAAAPSSSSAGNADPLGIRQ